LLVVGIGFCSPILRRQISALESAIYRSLERRGTAIGIILAVVAVAIVALMVTKPTV
jgi:mannose/fructose/N-acetylgalactosamine-specific phosphotransferase system component IID